MAFSHCLRLLGDLSHKNVYARRRFACRLSQQSIPTAANREIEVGLLPPLSAQPDSRLHFPRRGVVGASNRSAFAHMWASSGRSSLQLESVNSVPGGAEMGEPDLYWFRTRQDLLEEWGYVQSVWHLVRRTAAFITVVALDVHGRPLRSGSQGTRQLSETRVPVALIERRMCDLVGPFTIEAVPCADVLSRHIAQASVRRFR